MRDKDIWSKPKSSHPVFFLNHEFLFPLALFSLMFVTDQIQVALSVLGIRIYDISHVVPLLFYAGMAYLSIIYSFRSFMRWSQFRLSQQHPLLNFIMNAGLALLPLASIIINPLLLFPLLVIHWFSHVRAPDPKERKFNMSMFNRTYFLIIMQILLCLAAFARVTFEVHTIEQLTFWRWLTY